MSIKISINRSACYRFLSQLNSNDDVVGTHRKMVEVEFMSGINLCG